MEAEDDHQVAQKEAQQTRAAERIEWGKCMQSLNAFKFVQDWELWIYVKPAW